MRRWSDHDKRWGPFIYARDTDYKPWCVLLDSGEGEYPGCSLRIRGAGHTFIVSLPPIIRPQRRWKVIDRRGMLAPAVDVASGYWDEHPREYGFNLHGDFLHVALGAQTGDSSTTQDWSYRLPWMSWRHVRHSLYDTQGNHFWSQLDRHSGGKLGGNWVDHQLEAQKSCPSVSFLFTDFDGEQNTVRTIIEEREWRFGEKWCRWLSWFRKPRIARTLSLEFAKEVGPEKGSWKGGTLGHSIEMLPGELHEAAFIRYCAQEHRSKYKPFRIVFVGPVLQ